MYHLNYFSMKLHYAKNKHILYSKLIKRLIYESIWKNLTEIITKRISTLKIIINLIYPTCQEKHNKDHNILSSTAKNYVFRQLT